MVAEMAVCNSLPTAFAVPPRCETVDLFVSCDTHNPVLHDTIPLNHSDTSSLHLISIYSRLGRHPDRGWLCSLTRDQQYSRATAAALHHLSSHNRGEQAVLCVKRARSRTFKAGSGHSKGIPLRIPSVAPS